MSEAVGPVITDDLFRYQTDALRHEVEQRLASEASKAAHAAAGWATSLIHDAYMRGLKDGFAQGVARRDSSTEGKT